MENGINPPWEGQMTINQLHIQAVSDTVNNFQPNRVLNAIPPLIHPSETSLPRRTRTILCQLRSGHCAKLRDFQFRIGQSDSDLCPNCGNARNTSSHLFSCTTFPTNLTTSDLWERPREVARFLSSTPAFNDLPDPGPSPPPPRLRRRRRPPPEPPP